RPVHAAERHDRLRRARAHDAVVSGSGCRRAGRTSAHAQVRVPDVQRLHDRTAPWAGFRLLSARSALRQASTRGGAQGSEGAGPHMKDERSNQIIAILTAFLSLFAVVGFALYGLPRFYPYFVQELGWSRQQVTSGNAYSKIFVALAFGFLAGRLVDRFGPRRLLLGGIVMAGGALVGLSYGTSMSAFYFFYTFNALGYVFGGPLPNQVLLSRWFDKARGKAMGIAYLGMGGGGHLVPRP